MSNYYNKLGNQGYWRNGMKNSGKLLITLSLIPALIFGISACAREGGPTGGAGPTGQGQNEQQQNQQQGKTGGATQQNQQTRMAPENRQDQTRGTTQQNEQQSSQQKDGETGGAAGTGKEPVRGYW